jgi:catechol 2,3-dioxygenase-like lactoylglutathione lyase family enzyme
MKRFHLMMRVENLQASVSFYTALFGVEPTVVKPDYAKWLLEEPALNFSIAEYAGRAGIEHLGLQVDTEEELVQVRQRAEVARGNLTHEGHTTCCYAKSDKSWLEDPQGISWELFHTYGQSQTLRGEAPPASPCCTKGEAGVSQDLVQSSACC